MSHHVRINKIATICRFRAHPARKDVLRRAVDTTTHRRLKDALSQALAPVLEGHDGVIRIRRLDLAITTLNPLDASLAQDMAARIAAHVHAHLGRATDGIQSWSSPAAFMAHYVLWRIGIAPGAAWAFAEFEALGLLSPQQAAVEMLAARPETLAALARHTPVAASPQAFARAMDADMITALFQRLVASVAAPQVAALKATLHRHADVVAPLLCASRVDDTPQQVLMRVLSLIKALPRGADVRDVQTALLLAQTTSALARIEPGYLRATGIGWTMRLQTCGADDPSSSLLSKVAAHPTGDAVLDRLAALLLTAPGPTALAPSTKEPAAIASTATPAAGIALLLPGLVQLTQTAALTEGHRHAIALAALPEDLRAQVARSAGFHALFPVDPHAPPPDQWSEPDTRCLPDHLILADSPAARWAAVSLAHFADRLPGLGASSVGYLQDQFLSCTGDVVATQDTIAVHLHRVPLGIVLSMGGHLGLRGRIPWLNDRTLSIAIKGGV